MTNFRIWTPPFKRRKQAKKFIRTTTGKFTKGKTMNNINLKTIQIGDLKFLTRPGSSDEAAIREVVEKKSYLKYKLKIEAGQKWLDLGTNCGAFSVFAMSLGAKVESYEPDPQSAEVARRNIYLNNFTPMLAQQAVVFDDVKELKFSTHPDKPWRNSTKKKWKGGTELIVSCEQFANLVNRATHCKMDIEGAEIDILQHTQDFGTIEVLIFEWHFDIQPFCKYFHAAIKNLSKHFSVIKGAKIDPSLEVYKFFPPAKVIYCFK